MKNNVRLIRESKGMTMYRLAKDAGISAPFLLDLERQARNARPETMQRIANVLGCTVEDLIAGDDHEQGQATA